MVERTAKQKAMGVKIGFGSTRQQAIAAGGSAMSGAQLGARIVGNTVWGDYPGGFRFVSYLDPNGSISGTNNVGSDNTGDWEIDLGGDTLTTRWNQSWVNTTTRAVLLGGVIHLFDAETGFWRTNFDRIAKGHQPFVV